MMSDARFVAHTLSISERGAFVETDHVPSAGTKLRLGLSFPRLVAPVDVGARVVSTAAPSGPGNPSGMEVEFDPEDRPRILRLLSVLDPVKANPQHPPTHYRVLLVEDNDLIQDMFAYGVARYFRDKETSVTVDVASDGVQAWSMLQDGAYDLAIVDHYLPVLDGTTLLARVRSVPDLSTLPMLAISVGGVEVREGMLHAGADLFLSKPIVLRDLFVTLERLATQSAVGVR
jgi:CheY-like chemotaxis protein